MGKGMERQHIDPAGELSRRQREILRARAYHAEHREERLAYFRAYNAAHAAQHRLKTKEWEQAHPREAKLRRRNYLIRKPWMRRMIEARGFCRKKGLPFDLDQAFMDLHYQAARAIGIEKPQFFRVDQAKGWTQDNVRCGSRSDVQNHLFSAGCYSKNKAARAPTRRAPITSAFIEAAVEPPAAQRVKADAGQEDCVGAELGESGAPGSGAGQEDPFCCCLECGEVFVADVVEGRVTRCCL